MKFEQIVSIEEVHQEDTADLIVPGLNNFILRNGVISHNSGKTLCMLYDSLERYANIHQPELGVPNGMKIICVDLLGKGEYCTVGIPMNEDHPLYTKLRELGNRPESYPVEVFSPLVFLNGRPYMPYKQPKVVHPFTVALQDITKEEWSSMVGLSQAQQRLHSEVLGIAQAQPNWHELSMNDLYVIAQSLIGTKRPSFTPHIQGLEKADPILLDSKVYTGRELSGLLQRYEVLMNLSIIMPERWHGEPVATNLNIHKMLTDKKTISVFLLPEMQDAPFLNRALANYVLQHILWMKNPNNPDRVKVPLSIAMPEASKAVPRKISDDTKRYFIEPLKNTMIDLAQRAPGMGVQINCLPPDTIINGDYSTIEQSYTGQSALGMEGSDVVLNVMQRKYEGELVEIRGSGLLPIRLTPEHPVLVASRIVADYTSTGNHLWSYVFKWKTASSIVPRRRKKEGDYLVMPRYSGDDETKLLDFSMFTNEHGIRILHGQGLGSSIPLNAETAWIIGMYVAEGYIGWGKRSNQIGFSLAAYEGKLAKQLCERILKLGYHPFISKVPTGQKVIWVSSPIARFLYHHCGHNAREKRIPEFILGHKDQVILESFVDGYMKGDGCISRHSDTGRILQLANTASKVLAIQLQFITARLGNPLLVSKKERTSPSDGQIAGRKFSVNPVYFMRRHIDRQAKGNHVIVMDDKILCPVRRVRRESYRGSVWNLSTQEHTYLAQNIVVHNCDAQRPLDLDDAFRQSNAVMKIFDLGEDAAEVIRELLRGRYVSNYKEITDENSRFLTALREPGTFIHIGFGSSYAELASGAISGTWYPRASAGVGETETEFFQLYEQYGKPEDWVDIGIQYAELMKINLERQNIAAKAMRELLEAHETEKATRKAKGRSYERPEDTVLLGFILDLVKATGLAHWDSYDNFVKQLSERASMPRPKLWQMLNKFNSRYIQIDRSEGKKRQRVTILTDAIEQKLNKAPKDSPSE